jgi:DNA-binding response OmpR family regulator
MPLVLLLDADAPTLEALCELLEAEGYSCVEAGTGEEGLRILDARRPSLVIVADELLDMDVGAFLMAKKGLARFAATPVIVTTANTRLRQLSGAVALLMKPYGIDDLLHLIRDHLPPDHAPVAA